jgi:hypothetical protein
MKKWTLAKSLETLRSQLNQKYPNRSKKEDGSIGDGKHKKTRSPHNPNSKAIVTAIDITHDPKNGVDCEKLRKVLFANRDIRVGWIIWNREKKDLNVWNWRPYLGENPHDKHLHIDVTDIDGQDPSPWNLSGL